MSMAASGNTNTVWYDNLICNVSSSSIFYSLPVRSKSIANCT
jgi:hypothetical protein